MRCEMLCCARAAHSAVLVQRRRIPEQVVDVLCEEKVLRNGAQMTLKARRYVMNETGSIRYCSSRGPRAAEHQLCPV